MSDSVHPRSVNAESTLATSRLEVGKPRVTFEELRDGRRVNRIRVEHRLDHEWVAVYCLVAKNGRLVIAEQKICPYDEDARAGEWSDPPDDDPPSDKSRELHTASTRQALRAFLEYLEDECDGREFLERVFPRFELDRGMVLSEGIPRRRRRTDLDLARAAEAIANANDDGWRQAVADKMCCSTWTAYKWRTAARDRGFLNSDDELTDRARKELDKPDPRPQ